VAPNRPKVSVYIACYNYPSYLEQAIDSVLFQSFGHWELILIDDGSTDQSAAILSMYALRHPDRVRLLANEAHRGLRACANRAIEAARGDYIMRLDADDFLDENALLVLSTYLDQHPDVALVFPNYVHVDENGEFLGLENRKKVGTEAKLLDLPAHGACTMVRRRAIKMVGGYDEQYDAQDGHELWLKLLHRLPVANVSTPLFSYRRHADSLSQDEQRIHQARRQIKRGLVQRSLGKVRPRIAAIIPAKNSYPDMANLVLERFGGKPLIEHTLDAALEARTFDTILVTTDDPRVVEHCRNFSGVTATLRTEGLARAHVRMSQVLYDAVTKLEQELDTYPDIAVLLSVHSPLRTSAHIVEAVDTLLLHNVDNVISVYEDQGLHFVHEEHGLQAINPGFHARLRLEREALYVDNGAINAMWREVIRETDHLGRRIGHVVMPRDESFMIKRPFDAWLVEMVLERRRLVSTTQACHGGPNHEVRHSHDRHETPPLLREPACEAGRGPRRPRASPLERSEDVLEVRSSTPVALGAD
jgi:glycosyltransferase involved in cell wall biosynthesis